MPSAARLLALLLSVVPAASAFEYDKYYPYSATADSTWIYGDSLLAPPIVGYLESGRIVHILRVGPEATLVGVEWSWLEIIPAGWVRNSDLYWWDLAQRKVRIGPYWITHWELIADYAIRMDPRARAYEKLEDLIFPYRDFRAELDSGMRYIPWGNIPFAPAQETQYLR